MINLWIQKPSPSWLWPVQLFLFINVPSPSLKITTLHGCQLVKYIEISIFASFTHLFRQVVFPDHRTVYLIFQISVNFETREFFKVQNVLANTSKWLRDLFNYSWCLYMRSPACDHDLNVKFSVGLNNHGNQNGNWGLDHHYSDPSAYGSITASNYLEFFAFISIWKKLDLYHTLFS